MNRRQVGWLAGIVAAFVAGMLCGMLCAGAGADAAQKFGPEEVQSVPKSFLEGGDRSAAMLSQMLTVLRSNGETLGAIEEGLRGIRGDTSAALERLDTANRHLENIAPQR